MQTQIWWIRIKENLSFFSGESLLLYDLFIIWYKCILFKLNVYLNLHLFVDSTPGATQWGVQKKRDWSPLKPNVLPKQMHIKSYSRHGEMLTLFWSRVSNATSAMSNIWSFINSGLSYNSYWGKCVFLAVSLCFSYCFSCLSVCLSVDFLVLGSKYIEDFLVVLFTNNSCKWGWLE